MTNSSTNPPTPAPAADGIMGPRYRAMTLGLYALITACAFDQTAVTAIMPAITTDLGGSSLYAAAFVLPMSLSVVAMVVAGIVSDMRGRAPSLRSAGAYFLWAS